MSKRKKEKTAQVKNFPPLHLIISESLCGPIRMDTAIHSLRLFKDGEILSDYDKIIKIIKAITPDGTDELRAGIRKLIDETIKTIREQKKIAKAKKKSTRSEISLQRIGNLMGDLEKLINWIKKDAEVRSEQAREILKDVSKIQILEVLPH